MSLTRLSLNGLVNRSAMNLLGAGELFTTGKVFYVDSVNGADGNPGTDPAFPKGSINNTVDACVDNRGDIIVAMPNHVETVTEAGGLDLNKAGITVIGLGSGATRPQINFTTSTGADMDVDAADITVVNVLFTGGFDALIAPIDVNSAGFSLLGCEYRDVTGQAVRAISVGADRCLIDDFEYDGAIVAGGEVAIQLEAGNDDFILRNFLIDGNFDSAALLCIDSSTNIQIYAGRIRNRNSNDIAIRLGAASEGAVGPDIFIQLADDASNITEAVDSATNCVFYDPIMIANNGGERGLQWNDAVSTD